MAADLPSFVKSPRLCQITFDSYLHLYIRTEMAPDGTEKYLTLDRKKPQNFIKFCFEVEVSNSELL